MEGVAKEEASFFLSSVFFYSAAACRKKGATIANASKREKRPFFAAEDRKEKERIVTAFMLSLQDIHTYMYSVRTHEKRQNGLFLPFNFKHLVVPKVVSHDFVHEYCTSGYVIVSLLLTLLCHLGGFINKSGKCKCCKPRD